MSTLPPGTVHNMPHYIENKKVTSPIPGEREREAGETHIERQRDIACTTRTSESSDKQVN